MATTITWTGGDGIDTIDPSGTNNTVGFFGSAFGNSIRVAEFNDKTHVTNSTGTTNFASLTNNKFITTSGISLNASGTLPLSGITISDTTLRIHFNNTEDVETQNAEFIAFDRTNFVNDPSGVEVQAFEASASSSGTELPEAAGLNVGGDTLWSNIEGTTRLDLDNHPFASGDHYFFIGLSASPESIGEKTDLGFAFSTEFL